MTVAYDPYSYELDRDPYPVYRRMQDESPAYWNEQHGFWALTRFDDCLAAFVDWRRFSSARGTVLELMDHAGLPPIMIFLDPPRQTRLRNLVSKAFTPRRVAALAPAIRALAEAHLAPLRDTPRCDIVRDFTAKLPMDVISSLLGIPPGDRDAVRGWSNDMLHRDPDSPDPPRRSLEAQMQLLAYFGDAVAERRRQPRDDMMSALVQAELPDENGVPERLSAEEIQSFANLLAAAGNETVTKLLATALYWLDANPEQQRILRQEPGLIPNAVEETLRYDPPSQYQGRVLAQDVELHGRTLAKGDKLLIINGASGRDGRRFADPDRFDVRREIDIHLGFGYGQHICLGASLARLEARIALEALLEAFPRYTIPEGGFVRMHSSNVRGFAGLTLER